MARTEGTQAIARLLRSTAEVVSTGTDVEGALHWAVEVICEYTGWPLGHIFALDARTGRLTSREIWYDEDPVRHAAFREATGQRSFGAGEGLPGRILATGQPAWIRDVRNDPNFTRGTAATEVGLGAAFGFPITSSLGIEGVMEFFAAEPEEPDDQSLELIAHVGIQLGHLLDRSRAEEALRESEARLAEAESVGQAGSWSWRVGEPTVIWSAELYRIYGVDTEGTITFARYLECIHPDDQDQVKGAIGTVLDTMRPYEHEYRIVRPDGEIRWMHARIDVVAISHGVADRLAGHCQDITDRRAAEEERRLSQLELQGHQRVLERIARTESVNATLDHLCTHIEARYEGVKCSVLLVDPTGRTLQHVASPSMPASFCEAIDGLPIAVGEGACGTAAATKETVIVEDILTDPLTESFVELAKEHGLRSVWSHPMFTSDGEVIGTFALYRATPHRPDESELRTVLTAGSLAALAVERDRTQAALVDAANVDPLTGLANRARFLDRLVRRLRSPDTGVAVMFLDLDGFKWINDSLGHPAGDRILEEVADRLQRALAPHEVARFGGDEFTVMLIDPTPADIDAAADHVEAVFAEPFELDGGEFFLSCCIGIAVNDRPTDAYDMIRDADAAMFAAKERGRASRAMFDDGLRKRAVGRVTLESELRRAIDRDEFVMHYQPIVDLRSGEWVGAEALVRWEHTARGLVAPCEFIPLAEENGLIVPLGQRILELATADRASWPAANGFYVSVNVSAVQLGDPTMADAVAASLHANDLKPEWLVVEVTETAVMQRLDMARDSLEKISELGVRVVIDDFGAGYSSIARLGELPIAGIKIDNSFTARLGDDPRSEQVVAAITQLAQAMDLEVVAEGLETEAARSAAVQVGCQFGQGYHLSRPMPLAALQELLGRAR